MNKEKIYIMNLKTVVVSFLEWFAHQMTVQAIFLSIFILWLVPPIIAENYWLLLSFPITGAIPFVEMAFLKLVKDGWLYSKSEREESSKAISRNLYLLSIFNIIETGAQGLLTIHLGMQLGQISSDIFPVDPTNWTTWFRVIWQIWFMLLAADFANYFFHRWSHENRWFYQNFHSFHHESRFVQHATWSLFYVSCVEMFLSNVCFFCGIFVFKTDLFTVFVFGCLSSTLVSFGHSGILLPWWLEWIYDSSFHALHHSKYRCNFAEHFHFFDKLFGTYMEMSKEEKEARRQAEKLNLD